MNGLGSIPLWNFPFATDHCHEFAMAGMQHARRWKRTRGYAPQQDWTGLKLPFQQLSAALATKLKCYAPVDATWAHQRRLQFMSRIWWRHPHLLASVYCCEALPGPHFLLAWHPYSWSIMSLNWTGPNLMLPWPRPYTSFYSLTLLLGYTQIVPTTHLPRYHTLTALHLLVICLLWRQSSHIVLYMYVHDGCSLMKVMLAVDVMLRLWFSLLLVTAYHNNTLHRCLHGYTTCIYNER